MAGGVSLIEGGARLAPLGTPDERLHSRVFEARRVALLQALAEHLATRMGELGPSRRRLAGDTAVALEVVRAALRGDCTVGLDRVDRLAAAVARPAWRLPVAPGASPRAGSTASVDSLRCAVRRRLKERGWTVRELERRGGPSKSRTYSLLAGGSGATLETLARFAQAFGVEPWELVVPGNR